MGDNFRDIALDKNKNVFVYLYKGIPDEKIEKMLDKVAESFSDDPNFSFGKIDMDLNEVRRSELS